MEQKHTVKSEFIILVQGKVGQGDMGYGPVSQYDSLAVDPRPAAHLDAIRRCEDYRVGENALMHGTRYGVIKRTTIVLEEVIEPVRAAGWVEGLNEEIKTNRK